MFESIMERSGEAEVLLRKVATAVGPIKKNIKKLIRGTSKGKITNQRNERNIAILREKLVSCGVNEGDVVLIHSSLDGLRSLGLSTEEIIDFILDIFRNVTVVFAAFPIEPIKRKEIYQYDPKKTLCWTGMLPNVFLKRDGVFRSLFPYNTLAAKGPLAEEMMTNSLHSKTPHGKYTPWDYCRLQHAKILFLGTTSREANTMALHMAPDIMCDKWPIDDWYENRRYLIRSDQDTIEKIVRIQRGFWYRFVNEYKTDYILKNAGYLRKIGVDDIPIEIVNDSFKMMEFILSRCNSGKLMYSIPKKYWKK